MDSFQEKIIRECQGELGAAITQMIPEDDQIICNHVRRAHFLLGLISDLAIVQAKEIKSYRTLEAEVFAHNERERVAGELHIERIG